MKQPFYIGGIRDVEEAKGSAFGAAGLFLFIFVVAIISLVRNGNGGVSTNLRGNVTASGRRQLSPPSVADYGQVPTSEEDHFVT